LIEYASVEQFVLELLTFDGVGLDEVAVRLG
jgi:hypothetical protein